MITEWAFDDDWETPDLDYTAIEVDGDLVPLYCRDCRHLHDDCKCEWANPEDVIMESE